MKIKRTKYAYWIYSAYVCSLVLSILTKEQWYLLYLQPFLTIMMLLILARKNVHFVFKLSILSFVLFHNIFTYINILNKSKSMTSYNDFSKNILSVLIKNNTQKHNIFINAVPDPSPYLYNSGFSYIYSSQPLPVSEKAYIKFLEKMDYIVLNQHAAGFINAKYLLTYIKLHTKEVLMMPEKTNYYTYIFQIK
ncbi:hypothetical protein A2154_04940 [Candidatus Gottesmanbacteria bacterium RBG_16_43_7]|uniref:Uncharacterized protein n=1 Tax=Candidatus Gottesmanbacteria bacterium RBG_16_43_7 TaxID=1798373 RepID=A0A1F5ZDM6_9BACT|nr:MAG: hypothetical protein A2154_04940 [Candidatus Gottesmanbacteria bacterium RBG_16_43_7]